MSRSSKMFFVSLAVLFFVVSLFAIQVASAQNNEKGEKITICHIPPGNPDNPQTITVAKAALDAHLEHGDTIGECSDEPPPLPQ